jgi:hypothetical protein
LTKNGSNRAKQRFFNLYSRFQAIPAPRPAQTGRIGIAKRARTE